MWLLVLILGTITYYVIKRTIAPITNTSIWIIWLIMMTPALIWTVWYEIAEKDKSIPILLIIIPLVVCLILYLWIIGVGRVKLLPKQETEHQVLLHETENSKNGTQIIRPITAAEEKSLRECFSWRIYHLQDVNYRPQTILCHGKLKALPEKAYNSIKSNIEKVFGNRFLILFQEGLKGNHFFALVPNPHFKKEIEKPLKKPLLAFGLLLLTLLTTTMVGTFQIIGTEQELIENNFAIFLEGLPYSLGLISILGVHEFSHYLTTVRYKVAATFPYFIPIPFFLGTFGAFIQIKSPIPHRKALFDIAITGPLGGFLVTLPLLIWGISLSDVVPLPIEENVSLLNTQALDPRFSILFTILVKSVLGSHFIAGKVISLNPLAVAGYVGLIVTALNLIPVGQLDGGHIVHAMFGQKIAIMVGQLTRILMLILAMNRPEFLIWAILLFLMPIFDQPALNDVTELDNTRDFLGLCTLTLLLLILLPVPSFLVNWLQV
ncbi:site-2 protease family protein [Candidatus Atelocyanobacterium thalassae]|uniref:Peptidase M50 domain-containing protein n=1 Tax=cyanobacterium endosymbiont of Braarudosphaera bigelowii TaxID=1285375 RepID=A0ABM7U447_9CHRO|nr:site-2 protease family protein [Candidatus Atelocyanobacterium thalassa]BDA39432.1 hypothetical protein CPARK_000027100 [cyanobacterium endosymbiont of Braarudosphaera bigelowii]